MPRRDSLPSGSGPDHTIHNSVEGRAAAAKEFGRQARRLAHLQPKQENDVTGSTQAVEARFVTPLDPVVVTAGGARLPTIPVDEALKLNRLRDEMDGRDARSPPRGNHREGKDGTAHGTSLQSPQSDGQRRSGSNGPDTSLQESLPQQRTNPLFPQVVSPVDSSRNGS